MADERGTSLNQGFDKWLQVTTTDQLETWNGTDKMPALKESLGINDKASLSGGADANFALMPQVGGVPLSEKGTWTPIYESSNNDMTGVDMNISFANYIVVNGFCFVNARIRISSITSVGSGSLEVHGLPFLPAETSLIPSSLSSSSRFNEIAPKGIHHKNGSNNILELLKEPYTTGGASEKLDVSNMGTSADDNIISFFTIYKIA